MSETVDGVNGTDQSRPQVRRFECDLCHRWFTRIGSLTEHKHIHWNRYPFECEFCGKKFRQNSNLNKHRKLHQRSDPSYRCEECGRVFAVQSYLKSHQLSHKQTKDNLCHKCGQTFKFKSDLIRHLKIHDNLRQYKCEVCLLGFNDKSAVRRHAKRVHKSSESTSEILSECRSSIDAGENSRPDLSDHLSSQALASMVDYVNVCRILPVPLPNHIYLKLIEMQRQIGLELNLKTDAQRETFADLLEALNDLNGIVWEHLKAVERKL